MSDAFLQYILLSPDPVLVVEDDDGERIVAVNPAARALFEVTESTLHVKPLRMLLPNVVARSIAVQPGRFVDTEHFVRAWARTGAKLRAVTIGAVCGPPGPPAYIAVFVRSESMRLKEPLQAEVSEARLQFALDSAGIGDWDMDLRTNTAFRSRLHDACFGYTVPPPEWGYDTFLSHVHPLDRERVDRAFRTAEAGAHDYDVEFRAVWPDGSVHWLWSKGRFYYDTAARPIRIAGIQVDITDRKNIEEMTRISALAMGSTTDSIVIADVRLPESPIVYANAAFERMTGYSSHDIVGHNCRILQAGDTAQSEIDELRAALAAGRPSRVTLRNYRKDGTLFWNQLTLSPVHDESGELTHYVGVQCDVTRDKAVEAELLYRATHDPLTGLPNQALLEERLTAALCDADRDGTLVAVAFIDIDRLKRVNDSLGHAGGDLLISAVASRLNSAVRAIDTVARYGGDEFVILFPNLVSIEAVERLIARLRDILKTPLVVDDVELTPSASVGIALYPNDASSGAQLIRVADIAMYAVKANDRGSYRFFDRTSMWPQTDRLATENALRRALTSNEFTLDYQPIYCARTNRILALEALLRWRNPERGIVSPGEFVPLAEESDLIVPIGEWVLRDICRQHCAWKAAGVPLVPIAMNVSIAELRRRSFAATFCDIVRQFDVDPRWIVLEITESIVMDNPELFIEMLGALRATGAAVSIDDFGTGFSSLSYLKRLSLDTLKIDKSFVDDITTDPNAAAICQAVVTLAHSVGLAALAEGVETGEQAQILRAIGCDELQGYYFARPANAAATEHRLRAERTPAS